jgi:hypothetical protein
LKHGEHVAQGMIEHTVLFLQAHSRVCRTKHYDTMHMPAGVTHSLCLHGSLPASNAPTLPVPLVLPKWRANL